MGMTLDTLGPLVSETSDDGGGGGNGSECDTLLLPRRGVNVEDVKEGEIPVFGNDLEDEPETDWAGCKRCAESPPVAPLPCGRRDFCL